MKLLLDTCTALYLWSGDDRLPAHVAAALAEPANELVFHQVSYLEITLKHALGRLPLKDPPSILVPKAIKAYGIRYALLSNADIRGLESLPSHHRDPFDRLLVAHARHRSLTVVTPDAMIQRYDVPQQW